MTRFLACSVALALLLTAACSGTPADDRPTGSPEPASGEGTIETPSPGTDVDAGEDPAAETDTGPARFEGGVFRIGPELRDVLVGRNWKPGCPVAIRDLRLVEVSYWNFRGIVRKGPLVLHERVAKDVLWVFRRLFRARFRIQEIKLAAKAHYRSRLRHVCNHHAANDTK